MLSYAVYNSLSGEGIEASTEFLKGSNPELLVN